MNAGNQLNDILLFEKQCLVELHLSFSDIENASFYDLIEVFNSRKEDKIIDPLELFKSLNS
ncbi:hypothetical protein R5R51_08190 [Oenococcus oeni]|uniref:hypothetical protein n=1 Tax=Oenococcus oeni TaxID=1247 RepID=UPI000277B687|nr:hypothetical protein [Oenococcus oeni]AWT48015.1 hypothetical protein phiOE33PA_00140 [Oenococcus phage phiOE33PA]EJO02425.1 putative phage protein [Oenococcus oeni AWRIB318]EJO04099.1 putative phage protein [Oenococcus oeni AWRIB548]EJO04146.1 putative phage protein [Oenococcus oeni AWRIB548]EJO07158.1 putative phage protein [Oenococcus oeni AWRIB422]